MTESHLPELQNYLQRLENLREQVGALIADLPVEALNWLPIEGSDAHELNSLAVLASHIAGAERFWIHEVIDRQSPVRDRDAEFETAASAVEPLLQKLKDTGEGTARIFGALTPADLDETRAVRDRVVPVRWAILHVIDHTSLHLGHMQITYQLWQGGNAYNSPRWFQRLPGQ